MTCSDEVVEDQLFEGLTASVAAAQVRTPVGCGPEDTPQTADPLDKEND
ncbi:MAG: hypothetical protein NVS1B10_07020 [Candidatus Saccharimonadales bacterium]